MAESDSDSSVEKFLDKSQFSFIKKDLLSGTASNISISINVPNATTSQSVLVQVESDSVKRKGKTGSSKLKGTKNDSKSDEPVIDSNPAIDKYKNLNPTELSNIAARIQIFHQTGVVSPEHIVPCQNKSKTRRKKPQYSQKNTRSKKSTFGKRNIGTTCESFGIKRCMCCNVGKENLNESNRFDQNDLGELSQETLPTDPLIRLREREDRLIGLQQRQLLLHSEIGGSSITESEAVEPYIPQLTSDERERIQAYVNTIDPDNYSCIRSELNNSLEGRINNSIDDYADSIDKKTILERIDFEKERRSCLLQKFPHNENDIPTTSTPKFDVPQDDLQSNLNEPTSSNLLNISGIERLEPDQETQEDFLTLDRSNITIRGAKTAQSSLLRERSVDVKKEEHIMNYVNDLVASESQAISDEVEERFQRLYQSRRTACDALSEAVNPTQNAFEEEIVLDNSVEIVDVFSPPPIIVENDDVVCLSNNDSDVELILGPSTSTNTNQRKRGKPKQLNSTAKRKRQNKKMTEIPIVIKDEPEVEKKGSSALILRDCPICLEELASKEISSTTCGHIFCTKCIKEVIKTSKMCPNCRTKLTLKKIHPLFL